ncbi:MAG TPA: hypothetical protein VLZ74_04105 [Methylocella sp.]|nr:hypothetical protein [Methylocella sp.]
MCDIIKERIRINKILAHAVSMRLDHTPATLEELTQLCVVALQLYYDGACPDECVARTARRFSIWHLARAGGAPPATESRPAAA